MVKYNNEKNSFWKVNNFPKLDRIEIATVKSGVVAYETGKGKPKMSAQDKKNRIYHSNIQISQEYRKYLDGENVSRYSLTWNSKYIKYGENLAAMRNPKLFEKPRILVRQIPSYDTYAIEAVYTDEDFINDRNSMIITDIIVDPMYLLGIINSKILTIWFIMKFDKFQRRIFPQFKVNELGDFPIPNVNEELQNKIAQPVRQLMNEMKKESRDDTLLSILNTQIDELVMDLFQLNKEEKQSVRDFEV